MCSPLYMSSTVHVLCVPPIHHPNRPNQCALLLPSLFTHALTVASASRHYPYPLPQQAKPFADDYFATAYEECSLERYPPEGVCPDAVLGRNEEDEPGMNRNDDELNNVKLIYGHRVDGEWREGVERRRWTDGSLGRE